MKGDPDTHLLVVDDNSANRDMLTRRLQRLGHARIDTAEDGVTALEAIGRAVLEGRAYDAVLLDVMMPRMNGVQVLEAMAARSLLEASPVIMISAATEMETVVRCIELGAEDYLPKPFNAVLLQARLGAVLEKKRLRDALRRQLQRLEAELSEARLQQLSMVPDSFPASDPASPVEVHAVMHPAREVGGDLYDCFEAAPGVLCVGIGDVSDKGMSAALFMARTRSLLRAAALQHAETAGAAPAPSRLLRVLNEELCKNNPAGMFVSLFVGFLEAESGRFAFANAGHPRPFLLAPGHPVREIATPPEPPLGLVSGVVHRDHALLLARGEALVAITDGLADMRDPEGRTYSARRVAEDLGGMSAASPLAITAALAENARHFAAGTPAADDVTVLALRRL